MLTLKLLRDDPEYVIRKLAVKNFDARTIVEDIIRLDANRRSMQAESDALASQQKQKAALIGGLMKEGRKEEAEQAKQEVAALKLPPTRITKNSRPNWSSCPISRATWSPTAKAQRITSW